MEYADLATLRNGGYTLRARRNQRNTGTFELSAELKGRTWNNELGQIEGKCGAAVTNYFIFLGRLLILNTIVSALAILFYVLPYLIIEPNPIHRTAQANSVSDVGMIEQILLFTAGKGILGRSMIFYSYYRPTQPSRVICMCFIFGTGLIFSFTLVAIALSASQAIAVSIKNTGGAGLFMFSKIILNGWDHNISDHGAKQLKRGLITNQIENELYADRLRIENSKRDFFRILQIYMVRMFTTILNLAILAVSIAAVALAATQGAKLTSETWLIALIYSYIVSLTLAGTSIIAPFLFKPLINLQGVSHQSSINQLLAWRVALRFISIITLLACYYREIGACQRNNQPNEDFNELINNATVILNEKLNTTLGNPFNTTATACDECWCTTIGQEMYRLMIGWLIGHCGTILLALAMRAVSPKIACLPDHLFLTFDLTDHVLKVVSWQTVSLIGCFFAPFLPLLCLIIQTIVYYTSRAACLHIFVKSRENVYKSKSEAYFFTILLFFGFYIALILTLTALLHLRPPDTCGPFTSYATFNQPLQEALFDGPSDLRKLYNIVFSRRLVLSIIVILLGVIYFYSLRNRHLTHKTSLLETHLKQKSGLDIHKIQQALQSRNQPPVQQEQGQPQQQSVQQAASALAAAAAAIPRQRNNRHATSSFISWT